MNAGTVVGGKGTFIISFDCEGKWGVADHLSGYHADAFTNENLDVAYGRLVELLGRYGQRATFAFVGAFTMSPDEYHRYHDWFEAEDYGGKRWLEPFLRDVHRGDSDGWLNPTPLEMVRAAGGHEIASHGFTHRPLSPAMISRDGFLRELHSVKRVSQLRGLSFSTFIYPRNLVGYTDDLASFGVLGYRDCLNRETGGLSRIQNILSEMNILQSAQEQGTSRNVISIPSGYFLNWRAGFRKTIPLGLTLRRWKHAIDSAAENNKVIHLWTHPHNFIDGERQFELFERILQVAADRVRNGELTNLTQVEYCRLMQNGNLSHCNKLTTSVS